MADNVDITAGSGTTIGADDVGGVLMQRVKPVFGIDGAATDVSAGAGMPISSGYLEIAGTPAGAVNNDIIASTDVSAYRWLSFHSTGTFSGTITFQGSNDNSNWFSLQLSRTDTSQSIVSTLTTTNTAVAGGLSTKYLRVRCTAYSSGSPSGILLLSAVPSQLTWTSMATLGSISNTVPTSLSTWAVANALTSAARTTTQTGSDAFMSSMVSGPARGYRLMINVTSAGTGQITPKIQGKDELSNTYYDILVGAPITANGFTVLTVYPGLPAVANVTASDIVSRIVRFVITADNANSMTYSVAYQTMP